MSGVDLIAKERERQVVEERYDPRHDDRHVQGQLALAAACYAAASAGVEILQVYKDRRTTIADVWPWSPTSDRRPPGFEKKMPENDVALRLLVKAGALIVAEIERRMRHGQECKHDRTRRGKDAPTTYGSYRTEVCTTCGMFRTHSHTGPKVLFSDWRPAAEYEDAIRGFKEAW